MKVKIFGGVNLTGGLIKVSTLESIDAEGEINEFINQENIEVVDIKISSGDTKYVVLVMYNEK